MGWNWEERFGKETPTQWQRRKDGASLTKLDNPSVEAEKVNLDATLWSQFDHIALLVVFNRYSEIDKIIQIRNRGLIAF